MASTKWQVRTSVDGREKRPAEALWNNEKNYPGTELIMKINCAMDDTMTNIKQMHLKLLGLTQLHPTQGPESSSQKARWLRGVAYQNASLGYKYSSFSTGTAVTAKIYREARRTRLINYQRTRCHGVH